MNVSPRPISRESVPKALQKAERYRIINDPMSAESICLDVLIVEPANQEALTTLLLAITDQMATGPIAGAHRAQELLPRFDDEYKRAYYAGIICERCAKAQLHGPATYRVGEMAYHWLTQAMASYEKAEALRPAGDDAAILRWNTCVRLLAGDSSLAPRAADEPVDPPME